LWYASAEPIIDDIIATDTFTAGFFKAGHLKGTQSVKDQVKIFY